MKRLSVLLWCALFALLLGATIAGADQIVICGTGDSQHILREMAAVFEKANPGMTVNVPDSIGSTGGIKATAEGKCDLGRVARLIKEKEKQYNLNHKVFAFSPVVFVADPKVGVSDLTNTQVVDIFSGTATSWDDVGGPRVPVSVINREEKDSSRDILNKRLEGFKAITTPAGITIDSTPEAVEALISTDNAIGYLPMAMTMGKPLKVLSLDGVSPDAVNVLNGKYRPVAPFGFVWKGALTGLAKRFYEFVRGEEGRHILMEHGLIPPELL